MSDITRVNGAAGAGEFVGRDLFFKNFATNPSAAMSQETMEALVQEVQQTSTIEVIGSFEADTSTGVSMVISGADVTAVTGYTVTDVSGF